VDNSIMQRPNTLDYRFQVQSNGKVVPVRYTGVVPDTFKDGAEVVLKGTLSSDGFSVEPNGVMAKCPSKYTPQGAGKAGS
jgi:cytochrome c-type biogenesis protein CcmE